MNGVEPRLNWIDAYRHDGGHLRVQGRRVESTHECRRYIQNRVRERVRRGSTRVQLRDYLEELQSTGFSLQNIQAVAKEDPSLAPWEIGEVLAETFLEDTEQALFPWPPSWDKRTATASLPGPDLIGFHGAEGEECFLFGEAKSSDAEDVQNSVIYGDDGLRAQLERLLSSEDRRHVLIAWLAVRAEGQSWRDRLDRSLTAYFAAPSRAIVVGILLRGREAEAAHLHPVRSMVEAHNPTYRVLLLGFYLPIPMADWPAALEGSEERP
jgi:hypothetical protein